MSRDKLSSDSINQATKSRAEFSEYGDAKGAAGYKGMNDFVGDGESAVANPGGSFFIAPPEGGFGKLTVGLAWNNIIVEKSENFIDRFIKKAVKEGVDLDLGCLYELENGETGAIQAFGELFGHYDHAPFISHSGDERTGDKAGDDEELFINGAEWKNVKRVLLYTYIYKGPTNWMQIKPVMRFSLGGKDVLKLRPHISKEDLTVCALALLEKKKDGIQLTNVSQYFTGHPSMDRAFGFGLKWGDGEKDSDS